MKYLSTAFVLLLVLAATLHSVAQGSLAALDAKNGFKDAKLGTVRTQFKGLVPYKGDKLGSMVRPSDSKKIGDIPLKYIKYNFYKGRLSSILIMADISYKDKLLGTLNLAYGNGKECTNEESIFCCRVWRTKKVKMDLSTTLFSADGIEGVLISIESVSILQQIATDDVGSFGRYIDKMNRENEKTSKKRQSDL